MQFIYADAGNAFSVDLGTSVVRLGGVSLTETAGLGDPAMATITFDDPTGTIGNSSDGILGLKSFVVKELTAPANDQRIFTGYLGDRRYKRGDSLITGVERKIECDLIELNFCFSIKLIPPTDASGNRPQETPAARLTWLLATGYADVSDAGLVQYPTTPMLDAADYRNRFSADVLQGIADATGYNFFAYQDDSVPATALFFDNPNTSTAYSSALKLSNVLADIDTGTAATFTTGTTFAMGNLSVNVSPNRLASGVSIPYANGSVYQSRPATASTYAGRDRIGPNSDVKTAALATTEANRYLWENSTEDVQVTCSIDVPAAKVNAIRSGHRIQAKVSYMGSPVDYTAYTWFRVVQRTVKQEALTDDRYTLDLVLSPQEPAQPSATVVQSTTFVAGAGGGTLTFGAPVTIGHVLLYVGVRRQNPALAPTTISSPNFGVGAWTDLLSGSLARVIKDGGNPVLDACGIGAWAKVADSTSSSGKFDAYCVAAIYELSVTSLANITTVVFKDEQTTATNLDIGSLGSPATGSIGFLIAGIGVDEQVITVTHTGWTGDIFGSCFNGAFASMEVSPGGPFSNGFPDGWIGHQHGSGAAMEAQIALGLGHNWGGIGVLVVP